MNSSHMMMQEHGSFEIQVKQQTIMVKAFDAWNYETAVRFAKEYQYLATEIMEKTWACLLDLSLWEFATPEVRGVIDKLNLWANNHNHRFEVVICQSQIHKSILSSTYHMLSNVEVHFCEQSKVAYQWLQQRGVLIF